MLEVKLFFDLFDGAGGAAGDGVLNLFNIALVDSTVVRHGVTVLNLKNGRTDVGTGAAADAFAIYLNFEYLIAHQSVLRSQTPALPV